MEITTYNADGTINETKHIDLQVPEYVKKYDEQNSFLNITAEEVEVVNLRKNTFRKALLLRRLTAAIKHDYANFQDAYRMEVESLTIDIDVYVQKAGADPLIQTGDRIMTSIMRIYGSHSLYRHVKIIDDEQTFFEQVCTKKELYIYINKVEHQTVDGFGNLSSSNWINVLFYHAIKSANTNSFYRGYPNDATRFYFCLQNLINRYYYSLRNMEQAVKWMPDELRQQMYVLSAFVKKVRMECVLYFDEIRIIPKLVKALSLISSQHRRNLYEMLDIVYGRCPSIEFDNRFVLQMRTKELPKYEVKKHEITFLNYNKRPYASYEIDDNDICSLRIPGINNDVVEDHKNVYKTLQKVLIQLYSEFVQVKQRKWSGSVEVDAKIYFNKNKSPYENWTDFFFYEIEKYKYGLPESDLLKPQRSFFHLVCDNIRIDDVIGFSNEFVAGLLDIMIEYPDDNQEGLYECIYRMKYIKEREPGGKAKDAFEKAMKFIGCLFEEDCDLVVPYYKPIIKLLMGKILSLNGIRGKLVKVAPTKNFEGGFNLSLVYNVLGLLRKASIIRGGAGTIDKQIHEYAYNNGLVNKITERKGFIVQTTEIKEELGTIKTVIQLYLNQI